MFKFNSKSNQHFLIYFAKYPQLTDLAWQAFAARRWQMPGWWQSGNPRIWPAPHSPEEKDSSKSKFKVFRV